MNQSIDILDAWLVTLVCCRLDPTTVGEWQLIQTSRKLPKFTDLDKFLASLVSAYEVCEIGKHHKGSKQLVAKSVLYQVQHLTLIVKKNVSCAQVLASYIFVNSSLNYLFLTDPKLLLIIGYVSIV